jgi:hypothetical protein
VLFSQQSNEAPVKCTPAQVQMSKDVWVASNSAQISWHVPLSADIKNSRSGLLTCGHTRVSVRISSLIHQGVYGDQWRIQEFCSGGFNKFSWGQRTEMTGIWGQ